MWRIILAGIATTLLTLTLLAGCATTDEQRGAPGNDRATEEPDETDDQGAARTDEEEDQPQGQTSGEQEGEDGPARSSGNVDVTLDDYEIQGIEGPAQAGVITFSITNDGEEEHALAVEPAQGGELIGQMNVQPGNTEQLELELQPGEYTLFCPIGDHRDARGMETSLTVE